MKRLFLTFLFLLIACPAWSATYYIDQSCTYSGDGTFNSGSCASSEGLSGPKKSTPTISDGDTLLFKGDYRYITNTGITPNVPNVTIGSYNTTTGTQITNNIGRAIIDITGGATPNIMKSAIFFGSSANENLTVSSIIVLNGTAVLGTDGNKYCVGITHTSSDATKPVTGENYAAYWMPCHDPDNLYITSTWTTATGYYADDYGVGQINSANNISLSYVDIYGGLGLVLGGTGTVHNVSLNHVNVWDASSVTGGIHITGINSYSPSSNIDIKNTTSDHNRLYGINIKYVTNLTGDHWQAEYNGNTAGYSGIRLLGVNGSSAIDHIISNYNGRISAIPAGDGFVFDAGCENVLVTNLTTNHNADNGWSVFTDPNTHNNTVRYFTTMFNGSVNEVANPASSGDGFSWHGGTNTIAEYGLSAWNLNSGAAHVLTGTTGIMYNVTITKNGYQSNGSISPSNFTRGGISTGVSIACKNCIIFDNQPYEVKLSSPSLWTGSNNLFYDVLNQTTAFTVDAGLTKTDFDTWKSNVNFGGGLETSDLNIDPLFISNGVNFHLQSGSPARGAGVNVGLSNTNPPDIGAEPYQQYVPWR